MGRLRAITRLVLFAIVSIYFFCLLLRNVALGIKDMQSALRIRHRWGKACIKVLGIKVELLSPVPQGTHLYLANHRNYIDAALMIKFVCGTIVAKAEVEKWPVIGPGSRASHVIFIDRKSKDSRMETRLAIKEHLSQGSPVIIFPEGTTHKAPGVGLLRPGPFQIAYDGGFSVVPVAIEYEDVDDAWVGDDTFPRHFMQCFSKKRVALKIKFGDPFIVTDPETDCERTYQWMQESTLAMRAAYDGRVTTMVTSN
ncbi:MAG: lysophospholipid acyltransferase family protein [Chitinophagales bacterium]|nr:lysophospholipid acyltransferase family protein [Chitinophagales bacterium]